MTLLPINLRSLGCEMASALFQGAAALLCSAGVFATATISACDGSTTAHQYVALGWRGTPGHWLASPCDKRRSEPSGLLVPIDGSFEARAVGDVVIPCQKDQLHVHIRGITRVALEGPKVVAIGQPFTVTLALLDDAGHSLAAPSGLEIRWDVSGGVDHAPSKAHDWVGALVLRGCGECKNLVGSKLGSGLIRVAGDGIPNHATESASLEITVGP